MILRKTNRGIALLVLAMFILTIALPGIAYGEATITVTPQTLSTNYANNTELTITASEDAFEVGNIPVTELVHSAQNYIVIGQTQVKNTKELSCKLKSELPEGTYTITVSYPGGAVYSTTLNVVEPKINSITPQQIPFGYTQSISVAVVGENTKFKTGDMTTTVALISQDLAQVAGAISNISIADDSNLSFNLVSKPGGTDLPAGTYSVRVTSGTVVLSKQIQIYTPSISIAPAKLPVGYTNGAVNVTNNSSEFQTNATAQLFKIADNSLVTGGIIGFAVNSSDKTKATATLKPGIEKGNYQIRVVSGHENINAALEIYEASISLSVNQQQVGTTANISVTGTKTNFVQGTTKAYLYADGNTIPVRTINSPTVTSLTAVSFSLNATGLTAGSYSVQVVTGDEKAQTAYTLTDAPVSNFTVTTSVEPSGTGTVSGAGTYASGSNINLIATPNSGYSFDKWVEGINTLGTNTTLELTNLSANRTIKAVFKAIPVTVTGVTVKTAPVKVTYIEGQNLDLTGLVVTLTKSNTTTEDVVFTDFTTKGITTVKANGEVLATTDNSVTITHTASSQTTTQAIVVNSAPTGITANVQTSLTGDILNTLIVEIFESNADIKTDAPLETKQLVSGQVTFVNVNTGQNYKVVAKAGKTLSKFPEGYADGILTITQGITFNFGVLSQGDINGDDKVNFSDYALLVEDYNKQVTRADLNFDGTVNFSDYALLVESYNKSGVKAIN